MKKKYVSEKIICIKKYVSEKLICIKKTSCGLIYSVAIAPAARYFPHFCYFFFKKVNKRFFFHLVAIASAAQYLTPYAFA